MKRPLSWGGLLALAALSPAQTAPIRPQTPDIKVPPPVAVPTIGTALEPLTVEEAVRLALRNQPTIEAARGTLDTAGGQTRQTESRLGPTVGVTGTLQRLDRFGSSGASGGSVVTDPTNPGGGTVTTGSGSGSGGLFTTSRLALAVTQLLYDFGRTRDLVRQQRALQGAATENLTRAELDVAFDVRSRFADLVQNRRLVAIAESNVANRQSQLTLAQAQLDSGLGPPSDVVDAKTNLASAVDSLLSARANDGISRIRLAQAIGIDPRTPVTTAEESPAVVVPADPTALFTQALADRPEIRQAQKNVEATGFALSAARKTNSPSFTATASLGTNGTRDPFSSQSNTVGLGISWPFFDSGLTAGAIQSARGNQRTALAQYRTVELTVVSDVGQAYLNLATALQRIEVAAAGVVNAAEAVRIAEGRYRGNVNATFLEITNAQAQLYSAQQTLETARGDAQRAQAALDRAVGRVVGPVATP